MNYGCNNLRRGIALFLKFLLAITLSALMFVPMMSDDSDAVTDLGVYAQEGENVSSPK